MTNVFLTLLISIVLYGAANGVRIGGAPSPVFKRVYEEIADNQLNAANVSTEGGETKNSDKTPGVKVWETRFKNAGNGLSTTLDKIINTKTKEPKAEIKFVSFVTIDENGGPCLSALLEMVGEYAANNMIVVWLALGAGDDYIAAKNLLDALALKGAILRDFRGEKETFPTETLAGAHFLLTGLTGTEYFHDPNAEGDILYTAVTKLQRAASIPPPNRKFLVVGINVPSGIDKDGYFELPYPVDILLIIAFPNACLNLLDPSAAPKSGTHEELKSHSGLLLLANWSRLAGTEFYIVFYKENGESIFFKTLLRMIKMGNIGISQDAIKEFEEKIVAETGALREDFLEQLVIQEGTEVAKIDDNSWRLLLQALLISKKEAYMP